MHALKILLLEDDLDLGETIRAALAAHGVEVVWLRRLADAEQYLQHQRCEMLLLAPGPPDGDAMSLLIQLRRTQRALPVLVLGWRDRLDAMLHAFDAGADDYLPKPFELVELLARMRALARRSYGTRDGTLDLRGLHLHLPTRHVRLHGQAVALTASEFSLLRTLLLHAGRVMTRRSLEAQALPGTPGKDSNSLDVHMANLRRKIGTGMIRTVRGVGYVIDRQAPA